MGFKARSKKIVQKYAHEIEYPVYKKGETVLLIDGDILAFKVASVCESKFRFTHKEDEDDVYLAKSLKEFQGYLEDEKSKIARKITRVSEKIRDSEDEKEKAKFKKRLTKYREDFEACPKFEDYIREDVQVPDPFEYCAETLNRSYDLVMKKVKAKKSEIYIGGDENFRLGLPLKNQYKLSVRSDAVRPIHLTGSKEHQVNNMGAIKVKGIEADDILQMRAFQLAAMGVKVIMYSNDKDRLQGWYGKYYNPDNGEILELKDMLGYISKDKKGSGLKWLMYQVSQGDPIDGYSPKEWYSKNFYKRGYGQVGFFNDFAEVDNIPDFLNKFIEVHRDKLLIEKEYTWETWNGKFVRSNWLGIIELMFSCAYMKLEIDDSRTFSSLCKEFGVDAGELVFEVLDEVPNEDMGCVKTDDLEETDAK